MKMNKQVNLKVQEKTAFSSEVHSPSLRQKAYVESSKCCPLRNHTENTEILAESMPAR